MRKIKKHKANLKNLQKKCPTVEYLFSAFPTRIFYYNTIYKMQGQDK